VIERGADQNGHDNRKQSDRLAQQQSTPADFGRRRSPDVTLRRKQEQANKSEADDHVDSCVGAELGCFAQHPLRDLLARDDSPDLVKNREQGRDDRQESPYLPALAA
jgi:hypothetical protein